MGLPISNHATVSDHSVSGYVKVLKAERCDLSAQVHSDSRWLGGAVSGDAAMMT